MAPKIFLTGATGYIGGDVLYTIERAHADYEIVCLVRNSDRGAQVASRYPRVRLVYGSLDDSQLLQDEASKADVVLHCADADHAEAARALIRGVAARQHESPAFYIHTSGTGLLVFGDVERQTFGEESTKVFDDWDGVKEVTSIPEFALHRKVDQVVLDAAVDTSHPIKTAIVCPPTIYGSGRGPANQRSIQLPELVRLSLQRGEVFQVGQGRAHWTEVHVHDLSSLYLALVEQALLPGGGRASWGREGYYFAENGDFVWGEVAKKIAIAGHQMGLLREEGVRPIPAEEANELVRGASVLWGANSRCRAIRARRLLDWRPQAKPLEAEIRGSLQQEAKGLGLIQGHAEKAAGWNR